MPYTIEQIARRMQAECIGPCGGTVKWLLTDSRSLGFPEETLFFALVTKRGDGHRYIADLYRRGVRHFVVSERPDEEQQRVMPEANFLIVPDTLAALQLLAEKHRSQYNIPVVGITGSYGKTSTKYYLSTILSERFDVLMTPGSYNTPMGVVKTVRESLRPTHEVFVCEMGAKYVGDIKELCEIADPEIGIISSIGAQHLETFGSLENIVSVNAKRTHV